MDKVISARVDEATAATIDFLAQDLRTSKKRVIEEAVREFACKQKATSKKDLYQITHGAWKRSDTSDELRKESRQAFEKSMTRHHL